MAELTHHAQACHNDVSCQRCSTGNGASACGYCVRQQCTCCVFACQSWTQPAGWMHRWGPLIMDAWPASFDSAKARMSQTSC